MEKIYKIKIQFDRNDEDEIIFEEFLKRVKANLTSGLPASMGASNANLTSIEEE